MVCVCVRVGVEPSISHLTEAKKKFHRNSKAPPGISACSRACCFLLECSQKHSSSPVPCFVFLLSSPLEQQHWPLSHCVHLIDCIWACCILSFHFQHSPEQGVLLSHKGKLSLTGNVSNGKRVNCILGDLTRMETWLAYI